MLASHRHASGPPLVPMPLHPPQRIALKTSEPLFGHFRPDKHFLLAREGVVARLTLPRPHHVFTQLPGPFSHGHIQPWGRDCKRHLVRKAKPADGQAHAAAPISGMPEALVFPHRSKQRAHDPRSKHDMLLALRTVHVAASDITDVVQSEREPQARVPGEAEQELPSPCDKERVQEKAMRSM